MARSPWFRPIIVVCGLFVSGQHRSHAQGADEIKAASDTATATNAVTMSVDVRDSVPNSYTPYRYAFVTAGTDKYTYLVPEAYRVDSSDPAKTRLVSPDYTRMIVVGMSQKGLSSGTAMTAEALRTEVLARHAAAEIKTEQTVCANGQVCPALDYLWQTEANIVRLSRTTFVSTPSGMMEFTLNASPEQFEAGLTQLNLVLLTFRVGTNGTFDYVVGARNP